MIKIKLTKFIIAAIIFIGCCTNVYAENWGLHYPKLGEAPQGPTTAEELLQHNAYFMGCPNEKSLYLTFDAGYENNFTPDILDTLKKHQVPATFFLVGTYIRDNPELINRMVSEGHIVGNHTMRHPDMSKINNLESFNKELKAVEEQYKTITNQDMPKYYRPPKGTYSEQNIKMANELGYKTVFWSVAYVDWNDDKQPSKEEAFSKLIPRTHPGAIILLHNTSKTNALILDELITRYKEMGYTFKSIDTLCNCQNAQ